MGKNEIIEKIHREGKIFSICKKIAKDLADDLYQELIIILLEHKKLEEIYLNAGINGFNYWIIRIIMNIFNDGNGRFKKKFCCFNPLIKDLEDLKEDDFEFEILLKKTIKAREIIQTEYSMKKAYPLPSKIFDIYLREGSIRKVETITKINRNHIHSAVSKHRKEVIEKIKTL